MNLKKEVSSYLLRLLLVASFVALYSGSALAEVVSPVVGRGITLGANEDSLGMTGLFVNPPDSGDITVNPRKSKSVSSIADDYKTLMENRSMQSRFTYKAIAKGAEGGVLSHIRSASSDRQLVVEVGAYRTATLTYTEKNMERLLTKRGREVVDAINEATASGDILKAQSLYRRFTGNAGTHLVISTEVLVEHRWSFILREFSMAKKQQFLLDFNAKASKAFSMSMNYGALKSELEKHYSADFRYEAIGVKGASVDELGGEDLSVKGLADAALQHLGSDDVMRSGMVVQCSTIPWHRALALDPRVGEKLPVLSSLPEDAKLLLSIYVDLETELARRKVYINTRGLVHLAPAERIAVGSLETELSIKKKNLRKLLEGVLNGKAVTAKQIDDLRPNETVYEVIERAGGREKKIDKHGATTRGKQVPKPVRPLVTVTTSWLPAKIDPRRDENNGLYVWFPRGSVDLNISFSDIGPVKNLKVMVNGRQVHSVDHVERSQNVTVLSVEHMRDHWDNTQGGRSRAARVTREMLNRERNGLSVVVSWIELGQHKSRSVSPPSKF